MTTLAETDHVPEKLRWMPAERIWPNGLRYLWTDPFRPAAGVTMLPEWSARERQ